MRVASFVEDYPSACTPSELASLIRWFAKTVFHGAWCHQRCDDSQSSVACSARSFRLGAHWARKRREEKRLESAGWRVEKMKGSRGWRYEVGGWRFENGENERKWRLEVGGWQWQQSKRGKFMNPLTMAMAHAKNTNISSL